MSQVRKAFRVEQVMRTDVDQAAPSPESRPAVNGTGQGSRADEIIAEVRAVRALIEGPAHEAKKAIARLQAQIQEFQKLKAELDMIEGVIGQTKQELATIHVSGFQGEEMTRVSNELDAVVEGTEQATQAILGAVEEIDQCATYLAGAEGDESNRQQAHQIQDCVVRIFEACNFQDLTGQRITKVVATLKFIEEHIARMMEIWGGIEAFAQYAPEARAEREGDTQLLNGPRLDGEDGHVSQDDIDALFN
ncbi:MAG: protein phosphatase CheZ [Xanthobacteraceae bacterium]